MFQCKTRASAVALLTLGGGLISAAPALVIPREATAADRTLSHAHQALHERGTTLRRTAKNRGGIGDPNQRGLKAIGDPNIKAIGDPNIWLKRPLPPGP